MFDVHCKRRQWPCYGLWVVYDGLLRLIWKSISSRQLRKKNHSEFHTSHWFQRYSLTYGLVLDSRIGPKSSWFGEYYAWFMKLKKLRRVSQISDFTIMAAISRPVLDFSGSRGCIQGQLSHHAAVSVSRISRSNYLPILVYSAEVKRRCSDTETL